MVGAGDEAGSTTARMSGFVLPVFLVFNQPEVSVLP